MNTTIKLLIQIAVYSAIGFCFGYLPALILTPPETLNNWLWIRDILRPINWILTLVYLGVLVYVISKKPGNRVLLVNQFIGGLSLGLLLWTNTPFSVT
jgi:hypothetical protein